jgi:hypothetical protein
MGEGEGGPCVMLGGGHHQDGGGRWRNQTAPCAST